LRGADELIRQGRVELDGGMITELGTMVDPETERITIDGEPLVVPAKKRYYLFFKPKNVVSTMMDPEGRSCVADFAKGIGGRIFPAGRLDYDADGLMLLTNDGELSNRLMHPSAKLRKTYQVKISGALEERELERFARGVPIDGKYTLPAKIVPIEIRPKNSWYDVTIIEGRNRQIKRMFEYFQRRVLKIRRISIGPLRLEGLAPGEIRKLDKSEVESLMKTVEEKSPKKGKG